jgi:DNA-binding transcriptional ArsR family regulator
MATKTKRREAAQNRHKAMAHPLRAAVLMILTERSASPAEMSRQLGEHVGNVSHHTKRLVQLQCAELVDTRQVRGAVEHIYRATERHLVETEDWEAVDPAVKDSILGEIMQMTLDDCVQSIDAGLLGSDENFTLTRTRLVVDEEGRREALEINERMRLELLEVQARSAGRMAESGESGMHLSSSQGCYEVPPAS